MKKSVSGCLTACVSCGGWESGLAIETGKTQSPKKCPKNAARTHRQLHALLAGARTNLSIYNPEIIIISPCKARYFLLPSRELRM
jgi:hypothetical protein